MRYSRYILSLISLILISAGSHAQLNADFSADITSVCSGSGVVFTDQTTGISGGVPVWSWNFGTGATPATATGKGPHTVVYTGTGYSTVRLTVTDGIFSDTETKLNYITRNPLPVPVITGPVSACLNVPGNTYTTAAGMTNYTWLVSDDGTITSGGGTNNNTVTITWTATGTKSVRVNYTDANGCRAAAPTNFNTTVYALPIPSLTGPSAICAGSTGNVYTTEAGMSNYIWTISSGGTVTAGGGTGNNYVTVTWNTAGARSVSVNYTNSNGCTAPVPAVYNVTVYSLPVPTITGPTPVCAGTAGNVYRTQTGMTNYTWTVSAGGTITSGGGLSDNTVTVTWTSAGSRSVSVNYTNINGCRASSATVFNVTVNALPVPTAANNGPVCSGSALSLTGGPSGMLAYSWSGPNGFSNATMSPVVSENATVAMAGIYSLTVTNSNGCQATATTNAVVNASPVATASNSGPVCTGSPLTLSGGPSLMASYQWTGPNGFTSSQRNPVVSASATIAMAGKYILTVRDFSGCQDTASTRVYVNQSPVPTASNNGPVCSGTPLTLTGGPSGMSNYLWTGPNGFTSSLQNPVVSNNSTIAMSGFYSLTVTDANLCQGTAITNVVVNQSPVATAANTGPVCVGSQLNLIGGPAGMASYAWTGPNGYTANTMNAVVSPSATLTMAGLYTLTVTNLTGCQDTATTRAYVYQVPVSNAGPGGTECDLNFAFNAIPSVGTGLWSVLSGPGTASYIPGPNSPNAVVTVSAYGTYTFRWTETNGPCVSSSAISVTFYQNPLAYAGSGGDECDLDFVLSAVPSNGSGTWSMTAGTGTATFLPDANAPGATVTVTEYGAKEFTWIESNGICSDTASVIVNFYQQPVANAGSGGNNCGLDFNLRALPSIGTGTWTTESGPGTATFSPDASSFAARVTVNAYGTYIFRWTEVNGNCSSSSTVTVTFIQQPSANAGPGGDPCVLTFSLNAVPGTGTGTWTKVSGPGNVTFTPNSHQYNATVTVTQYGSYDFAWTETNSLCTSSDIVRVTFHDKPQVDTGADLLLCKGSSIRLNATGTGSFSWLPAGPLDNPNIYNPLASPDVTTTFTVTLTDQWGCKNTDQVVIEVRTQPVANAGPDQNLDFTFETNMAASPLGTSQTGLWTLLEGDADIADATNPATRVSNLEIETNTFLWTVTNGVCPASTDTVRIMVKNLIIPTLITPNLDGNNDFFEIRGLETMGRTSLTIFNRWGARVYENDDYDNSWEGKDDKDNPLPEDTYFFILKPEEARIIKGYIVIRR